MKQSDQRARILATLVGAFVTAWSWVGATDEPPSLDQIKGDLKTVKPDAPELAAPVTGPTLAVPLLLAPAEEPALSLRARSTSAATEKKRTADSDWLVRAMTEPRAETGAQRRSRQTDSQQSDLMPRDSADPNFLLKVYRAQEIMEREKREASTQETLSPPTKSGDVGSFSDLLQHWISPGGLPLSGLEPGTPADTDGGFAPSAPLPAAAPAAALAEPPKHNPFLDAAQLDPLPSGLTAEALSPPDIGPAAVPAPANLPDASPTVTPSDSRRDAAPSPPARPTDDKKYFPQLDRF
jgi:hypothetical protein